MFLPSLLSLQQFWVMLDCPWLHICHTGILNWSWNCQMLLYSHPLSRSKRQESSYRSHRSDHQHSLPQGDSGPPPRHRDSLQSSSPGGREEGGSSSDTWRCSGDPRGRRRGGTSCSPARRGGGGCWHTCEACHAPAGKTYNSSNLYYSYDTGSLNMVVEGLEGEAIRTQLNREHIISRENSLGKVSNHHSDNNCLLHSPLRRMSDQQCDRSLERTLPPLHAQRKLFNSSSWVDRFRISDRKFVNHTTEMILWSMILLQMDFTRYSIEIETTCSLEVIQNTTFLFQLWYILSPSINYL